ncbi:hypothetical protein Hanom_Chr09g00801701 [Helianthus anomalus]
MCFVRETLAVATDDLKKLIGDVVGRSMASSVLLCPIHHFILLEGINVAEQKMIQVHNNRIGDDKMTGMYIAFDQLHPSIFD